MSRDPSGGDCMSAHLRVFVLSRQVVFPDPPPLCPCAHACSLRGCPFRHDRRLLPEITRAPPPQGACGSSRCGNDDCYAPAAKGKFCCNPCEAGEGAPKMAQPFSLELPLKGAPNRDREDVFHSAALACSLSPSSVRVFRRSFAEACGFSLPARRTAGPAGRPPPPGIARPVRARTATRALPSAGEAEVRRRRKRKQMRRTSNQSL